MFFFQVMTSDLDHLTDSFDNMKIDKLQNLASGTYLKSN